MLPLYESFLKQFIQEHNWSDLDQERRSEAPAVVRSAIVSSFKKQIQFLVYYWFKNKSALVFTLAFQETRCVNDSMNRLNLNLLLKLTCIVNI